MEKNPEITDFRADTSIVSQQLCPALREGTNPPPATVKKSSLGELGKASKCLQQIGSPRILEWAAVPFSRGSY